MGRLFLALIFCVFALAPRDLPAQDTSLAGDDAMFTAIPDLDSAVAQASQQIDDNPSDPNNYIRRGRLYFTQGDYRHSISDYSTVLQSDPNNAIALFQRARAYYHNNDQDLAVGDYNQFLQLRPNTVAAYINLGAAYLKKGDYEQAIASEDQALQLRPDSALAHLDRGRAYKLKGDFDKAIADFTQSLGADPKQPAALVARGLVHNLKGDYEHSRSDYTTALQLDPDNVAAHKNLAWLLATATDPKFRNGNTAVTEATKAFDLSKSKDAGAADTLAAAYAETGDFDNAVKWENKYFTFIPPEEYATHARERMALYQKKQPYHQQDEALPAGEDNSD